MQTLEYHGSEVILCYTPVPSEAKVSPTENINIHACGDEFDGLYISLSVKNSCKKNLKLKQFRILSRVIPLLLKLMLDRTIFVCAELTDFMLKTQKLLFTYKYVDLLVFGITGLCENSH